MSISVLKILVTDDQVTDREIVCAYISRFIEPEVLVEANTGLDALEKLSSETYNLVVTDLNMPEMDGYELIEKMRDNSEWCDIPIVVVSGAKDDEVKLRCKTLGASAFFSKPLSHKSFVHCLQYLLGVEGIEGAIVPEDLLS